MNYFTRFYVLVGFCISFAATTFAQSGVQQQSPLTHWMTPEELLRKDEIGRGFVPTPPPVAPVISVAEFMPSEGVLVRYPFGIPMSLIKELSFRTKVTTIVLNSSQQNTVTNQYSSNGVNLANCEFLLTSSDSYWTRDYGPWYIIDSSFTVGIVDFPYNRPRPNDDEVAKVVAQYLGIEWYGMNVIHTGGNYMSNGGGQASSTELVYEENPSISTATVAQRMHDYLGIDEYLVRPDPNNTYIDHIDCWAKFLDVDKILVRSVPQSHPQYAAIEQAAAFWQGQLSSYGTPYQVFRVNTPNDEPYTNSLILNKTVYLPIKGNANDLPAKAVYQAAMPGYEILTFTALASAPWEGTDALHCRTHEMADRGMLLIRHMPILTQRPWDENYQLSADVVALSKQGFYNDSLLVNYRVNTGDWMQVPLTFVNNHLFEAVIPRQAEGDVVEYYIHAADSSGRSENHPYIGAPDPHKFTIGPAAHPHIAVNTMEIDTFAYPGNTTLASISFTNTGAGELNYSMTADANSTWIAFPQPQGVVLSGNTSEVPVELASAGLINGVYHGYIYIASNDEFNPLDSVAVTFGVGDPAGILSAGKENTRVFTSPNPFSASIKVSIETATAGISDLALINSNGQQVWSMQLHLESGINVVNLNQGSVASLPGGVYVLMVKHGSSVAYKRVVKLN